MCLQLLSLQTFSLNNHFPFYFVSLSFVLSLLLLLHFLNMVPKMFPQFSQQTWESKIFYLSFSEQNLKPNFNPKFDTKAGESNSGCQTFIQNFFNRTGKANERYCKHDHNIQFRFFLFDNSAYRAIGFTTWFSSRFTDASGRSKWPGPVKGFGCQTQRTIPQRSWMSAVTRTGPSMTPLMERPQCPAPVARQPANRMWSCDGRTEVDCPSESLGRWQTDQLMQQTLDATTDHQRWSFSHLW